MENYRPFGAEWELEMLKFKKQDLVEMLRASLKKNKDYESSQLEPPVMLQRAEETKKCLKALGSAWRGDWSGFDGRTLRGQLEAITTVLDGKLTYEQFCEMTDIHPEQLCWNEYSV